MEPGNDQQEIVQKKVAFYQSFLSAWIDNRMETDKQLLTLSALAIGLLATFHGNLNSVIELVFWAASAMAFVTVIIFTLLIFQNNSEYIGTFLNSENNPETERLEKSLRRKTVCAFWLFILGIILTVTLVITKAGFAIVKI